MPNDAQPIIQAGLAKASPLIQTLEVIITMKWLSIVAALLISSQALAWETPSKAISEFMVFELDGARLTGDKWNLYTSNYIAAPDGYDESGWDEATVIENYKILDIKCKSPARCEAAIEFTLFPTANLKESYVTPHPSGGKQLKSYAIVKKMSSWLIEPGFGHPIISIQAYNKYNARLQSSSTLKRDASTARPLAPR